MAEDLSGSFDAYYYQYACGQPYTRTPEWLAFFNAIAVRIAADLEPKTVLDAGCAFGMLVESLRQNGIDAFGIDISEYAIQSVHESIRPYCRAASVTTPFPQNYDLIISMEVLEHMPKDQAELAVINLCRHSDQILFSSSPYDYKESTHCNVQPPEYWAEHFARQGFYRDVDFDASFLTQWAVLFRKRQIPAHLVIKDYERRFWLLWKENTDLRALLLEMRNEAARQEQVIGTLKEMDARRVLELQAIQGEIADLRGSRILQLAFLLRSLKRKLLK
jgi:SAM-dependent methyltransferase